RGPPLAINGGHAARTKPGVRLMAQTEVLDQLAVGLDLGAPEVPEELAATSYHPGQTPPGVIGSRVRGAVPREVPDLLREQRDLHLGRAGIQIVELVLSNDVLLLVLGERHRSSGLSRPELPAAGIPLLPRSNFWVSGQSIRESVTVQSDSYRGDHPGAISPITSRVRSMSRSIASRSSSSPSKRRSSRSRRTKRSRSGAP